MDTEKLLAFISVTEANSFSKGAEMLFLNQPTLSARIKALESELDVELFERTKGKAVKLSTYGHLFLPYAKKIVEMMLESKNILEKEKDKQNTQVRIGTSVYGNYLLPDLFGKFHLQIPNIEISVVSGYTPEIVEMVMSGLVDVAFVNDIVPFNEVENIKLLEQELLLIYHPSYITDPAFTIPIENLLGKTLIIFGKKIKYENKNKSIAPIMFDYIDQHRIDFKKILFIDQIEPLKGLIKKGNGFALFPKLMVEPELERGDFISRSLTPPVRPMAIHFIYRKESENKIIREIKKIVLAHFQIE
ncbi:LysR family transcriptional regulator [Neobacillus sp. Marseille-QA0830]